MNYEKVKRAAYDSFDKYDPDYMDGTFSKDDTVSTNYYDPDYADNTGGNTTVVRQARPGQKLQINLTINNPAASKLTFELFNAYKSVTRIFNPAFVSGAYTMIPLFSREGLATGAPFNGTVGFDQNGNLYMRGGGADPVATIGCSEYPYASLLETTKVLGFKIVVIRVSVATQAQFNNNIFYRLSTYGGVNLDNTINVRSYKRLINPAQLDIDVKAGVTITGESGLTYALEAGEAVQLGLYINKWAKPSL